MVGVNFASGGSGILRYTGYKQSVTFFDFDYIIISTS